jgi:DNA-binding GntR family transcriptional regulator
MNRPKTATLASRGKATASDVVSKALSRAIHEHRLGPGTKLGEDELAEIYGVSRTIIRSALQSLAHRQLVEIYRNRGAFVAKPTTKEAREVFETRELLEPRSARMAARYATAEDAKMLQAHIEAEHAALAQADHGRALYLSGQLHIHIARIADHSTIANFIEHLIARSSLIVALYWKRESALCEKHAHHSLVDAISRNDEDAAEALMRSHLVDLHSALELRKKPSVGSSLKDILG